uniref:Uncharacterized protein n=1 Tax=Arundo donax TaxID=35708 RepID=A0A0A9EK51_ARUDO
MIPERLTTTVHAPLYFVDGRYKLVLYLIRIFLRNHSNSYPLCPG